MSYYLPSPHHSGIASGENEADSNATANFNLTDETWNATINATDVTVVESTPLDLPKSNKKVVASVNSNKPRKECPCHSRG